MSALRKIVTSVSRYGRLSPTILAVTFVAKAMQGHVLSADSPGYIAASPFRTPVYPLFLDLVELAAPAHASAVAATLQLAFGLLAVDALVRALRRLVSLSDLPAIAVLLLFLYPYVGRLAVGTAILSEGLAYPLFLLAMRSLLIALVERSHSDFVFYLALWVATVLTRPQFLFMIPPTVLLIGYWAFRDRSWKRSVHLSLMLVGAILLALLLDRSYHFWRHGAFAQVPFTGIQLMVSALYLSDADDGAGLPPQESDLLAELQERAWSAGLSVDRNTTPGGITAFSWHYRDHYNDIVWATIFPVMADRLGHDGEQATPESLTLEDWIAVDRALLPLALKVLLQHKKRWLKLYLSNIATGLGSRPSPFTHLTLLALGLVVATLRALRTDDRLALLLATAALFHVANFCAVATVEPLSGRYLLPTDMVFLAVAGAVILRLLGQPSASSLSAPAAGVR